jgi:hypothetical protein
LRSNGFAFGCGFQLVIQNSFMGGLLMNKNKTLGGRSDNIGVEELSEFDFVIRKS